MKKLVLLLLLTLIHFQSSGQNIIDDFINRIINNFQETETTDENFVRHDTILNKLGLTINAVCKVSLMNGQQVEGFIQLAGDGDSNGFYFEDAECVGKPFSQFMKLSLSFERFERQSECNYLWFKDKRILNWPVKKDTIRITKAKTVRFMDWNGSSRFGTLMKKDLQKSDEGLVLELSRTSKQKEHYKLYDSLSIFLDLAPDTYIRESVCPVVKVRISDIESFELIARPDQKWLAIIEQNRENCDQAFSLSGESGTNQKSNWYHVIIKNTDLTQFIQYCLDISGDFNGDFGEK